MLPWREHKATSGRSAVSPSPPPCSSSSAGQHMLQCCKDSRTWHRWLGTEAGIGGPQPTTPQEHAFTEPRSWLRWGDRPTPPLASACYGILFFFSRSSFLTRLPCIFWGQVCWIIKNNAGRTSLVLSAQGPAPSLVRELECSCSIWGFACHNWKEKKTPPDHRPRIPW